MRISWDKVGRAGAVTAVAAFSLAWFFRYQIAGGFRLFFGDRYDAMIEVALLRHWGSVLAGREAWNAPGYFWPHADTLGYNDGYFGYGLLYALFRALGLPLVAAAEAVHATFKAIGFFGMYALLGGPARCRWGWSLFGAALFTIADLTLIHANHGQLFTLALAPWAMLLGWRVLAAVGDGDRRALFTNAAGFAIVFALWVSTAYYLAWFFVLFAAITLIVATLANRSRHADWGRGVVAARWPLLAAAALALVLLVPFLSVYLPKARETGMWPYAYVRDATLPPLELINPGVHNWLWSPLFGWLRDHAVPGLHYSPDAVFGMPPLLVGLAIGAFWWAWRRDERAIGAIAAALLIAWLLVMRLGSGSAWWTVHAFWPGARGVRVVGRFQLLLLLPAVLLATILLDRVRRPGLALVAAALLLVEQIGTASPLALDQAEQQAMLAGIPRIPAGCRSFTVVTARPIPLWTAGPAVDRNYAHNVDAMVLAAERGVPTVNGIASFNPPDWSFADPQAPDYLVRVRAYAQRHGLRDVCVLDRRQAQPWSRL